MTFSNPPWLGRIALVVVSAAGLAISLMSGEPISGPATFLRLTIAAALVFILPGVTVVLACRPLRLPSLLDTLAIGATVSLVLMQIVTGVSILGHIAFPEVVITFEFLAVIGLGLVLIFRRSVAQRFDTTDIALLAGCLLVAGILYPLTPLFARSEDQIHVAVIRRLVSLAVPQLDNIYMIPNLVFWYPVPGLQGAVAAVAVLSGTDPIVAYAKLRGFWSLLTLLLTSRLAVLLFGGQKPLRVATGLTLVLFALNGTLSDVPFFYMSQMTSVSHPSDVGMNVYLPALMILTLLLLRPVSGKRVGLLALTWFGLFATICVIHIREAAQLTIYLGAYLLAELVRRSPTRRSLGRTAWMTVVSALTMGAWGAISRGIITGHVDSVTKLRHRELLEVFSEMSFRDYLYPAFADNRYTTGQEVTFHAWLPVALAMLPGILIWRRCRREALFAGASTLVFLLLIQIPILSVAYLAATYYEILFVPIRNFFPFLFPAIGIGAVALLVAFGTLRPTPRFVAAAAFGGALFATLPRWGNAHRDAFHLLVAGAMFAALWFLLRARPSRGPAPLPSLGMVSAVVVALAIITWTPRTSPVHKLVNNERSFTRDDLLDLRPCDTPRACNPSKDFILKAREILGTEDVVAISLHNPVSPTYYFRAQAPIWPGAQAFAPWTRPQFPTFFAYYDRATAAGLPEPFFNGREDLVPRIEFLEAVGATYVMVDPLSHEKVTRRIRHWPRHFEAVLDDGMWALYRYRP